jgi:hypothetical protein
VGWTKLLATWSGTVSYATTSNRAANSGAVRGAQRTALETTLFAHVAAPAFAADLRRLQTIPGVGPIVGATVLAVFSDEPRGVRAHHQTGSGALRAMLREAAHHASRPAHPLHPYFASLCAKRGYKMATIAVAHRLARITFAMLRDGADFDVAQLNIKERALERTTIRRYRLKRPAARG